MPPTTGHLQLIQFASRLKNVITTDVLVCTQPFEPFPRERVNALIYATRGMYGVRILVYSKEIEQNPDAPGFWETWRDILKTNRVGHNTVIVSSEPYGKKLADLMGAKFMPYDIDRQLNPVKATEIREDPAKHFNQILPEFRRHLQTKVTIFGAESTGKTTLAKELARAYKCPWTFEYARPYLENTVNEITISSMKDIWSGQAALQKQASLLPSSLVIQDTDLYSTVGYWELPHWEETLGRCPEDLYGDAKDLRSDLYIVCPSNIPFEQDPLRYGGDHREGSDAYWIGVCERYGLPYFVLQSPEKIGRAGEAIDLINAKRRAKLAGLTYDRHGL